MNNEKKNSELSLDEFNVVAGGTKMAEHLCVKQDGADCDPLSKDMKA